MKSKLFVPASRPELFIKAMSSAAHAVSFDLEDAVVFDRKAEARGTLARWLASDEARVAGKTVLVRVNAPDTPWFAQDIAALARLPAIDIVNVPKLESAAAVVAAAEALRAAGFRGGLLVNIETARGFGAAAEIAAAHPAVCGLQLGLADLFEPLGIARYEPATLRHVMLAVRLAAGASGKYAVDAAYADVKNAEGFRAEAELSRSLGFIGKSCIHPTQVAVANAVYAHSDSEIAQARRIVTAAADRGQDGAFLLDGRMIDAPFIQRARDILRTADNQSPNP